MRKDNLAVKAGEHADGSDYYRAEDNTKGRGWELTLSGEPLPDWRVDASYTRTKIEDRTGARLKTDAPLHLFKAFSSYDVNEQWTIGGGINWQSKIFAKSEIDDPSELSPTHKNPMPPWTSWRNTGRQKTCALPSMPTTSLTRNTKPFPMR